MPLTFLTPALTGKLQHKLGVLALCAALPALANAAPTEIGPDARTDQVEARLLSAHTAVQPGQVLQLGLRQRIAPHWHTYWLNPGDSGMPTTLAWDAASGATPGRVEWPTPKSFRIESVVNYGYDNEVVLLTSVTVPRGLKPGDTFRPQLTADWLVCQDSCIPQQVLLALALPVRADAPPPGPEAAVLAQARQKLPQASPLSASWSAQAQSLSLRLQGDAALPVFDRVQFFPARSGLVASTAAQTWDATSRSLQLSAGDTPPAAGEAPVGVLVFERSGQSPVAWAVGDLQAAADAVAAPTPVPAPAPTAAKAPNAAAANAEPAEPLGLAVALALAVLGGLVLNLMPCVFPVLSIKAWSLLKSAEQSPRAARWQGLAYTAGVLASFVGLAVALLALKASGAGVGWGFQFQSPAFVLLMALLMLGLGLSLSGVVTLGTSITGVGGSLADRDGLSGSFFTGVLATVVATPCTAPFMGAALGYALTQPAAITLAVFVALGSGLALPYLALSWWPALQRRLPRPGAWMERVKQGFAFPMYGTAAWLLWVLTQQAGATALAVALAGAVLLAFAAWLYQTTRLLSARSSTIASALSVLLVVISAAGGAWSVQGLRAGSATSSGSGDAASEDAWSPYSPERLQALRSEGKPVFVNLTADWCITCLVNERVALSQPEVDAAFTAAGVTRLKGDWTLRDTRITELLAAHGRTGVPLYLYYPAGRDSAPQVLPQLLTPALVRATLQGPGAQVAQVAEAAPAP